MDNSSTYAVAYYRYSSNSQTEASIERQQMICREYASNNNIVILHEYIDRACTGTNTNRDGLVQLLSDAPTHSFNLVLVYALNRLGRSVLNTATTIDELSKNKIAVFSVTEKFDDSCTGKLMEHIAMGFDEFYSAELRKKILEGNHVAASKGLSLGKFRLGYKTVDRRYVIDTVTAPIVKELFRQYAYEGTSMQGLLDYLNKSGAKNCQGNSFKWHSLHRILTNRMYIGEYWVSGTNYGNLVPQIVEKKDFELVQERLAGNKKAPARSVTSETQFLLTTKLFNDTGVPMSGKSGHSHTGKKYSYYSCSRAKNIPHSSITKPVKKDIIEKQVIDSISNILTDDVISAIAKEVVALSLNNPNQSQIISLRAELAHNKMRINNLLKAIEEGQAVDILTAQLVSRQQEQESLRAKIAELSMQQAEFTEQDVIQFLEQYKATGECTNSFIYNMINILVNKVTVSSDCNDKMKVTVTCNAHSGHLNTPVFFEGTGSPYCMLGGAEGN